MRATTNTTYRSLQMFLDNTSESMQTLQLAAATGKRLNRPSDDPTAISPVLSARTQIQASDRYIETIETGLDHIDNMEGYMDSVENTLVRAKEIAIASINGSLNQSDLDAYATEIAQLRTGMMADANAQVDGKYLFAGYSEKTTPFTSNPAYPPGDPVLYNGDYGVRQLEIAPNELVEVGITGASLMMGDLDNDGTLDAGAVDLFAVMTTLEEDLLSGNMAGLETALGELETGADQIRNQRSLKGAIGRRLETALDHMEEIKVDMEEYRSRYEDADILETLTDLAQMEQSFEAALNITGKVSDLSILDYL